MPMFNVNAFSIEVLLSDYDPSESEVVDLHILFTSGSLLELERLDTSDASIFEEIGDELWKLKFAGIDDLAMSDVVDAFTIFAIDDDPDHPKGAAEHFFITGMTGDATPIPAPASLCLGLIGLGTLGLRRIRKNR